MPGPRDEDLDWLYGRDRSPAEPEHTRVMPLAEQPGPPVSAPRPTAAAPPSAIPPGYPPRPAYGSPPNPPPNSPPPYGPPPPAAARPPKKRHPVRNTFRVLGILLLLMLVWLIGVPAYAWSQVERVDAAPPGARPGNQPGQTFLLVGSDSREGLSKAEQ